MSEVAVITGTTHGIGRVTSRELARAGRTVVMLCRDTRAAQAVRDEIIAQLPGAAVDVVLGTAFHASVQDRLVR